ncbi:Tyrosine-protein kinase RYK [Stylophora pistillata]|uniref:Tyrosine-protein kinase RYK n=1 Tax=Stylophora pistillata TaxID=50429 RepID=A0A2B4SXJ5_STYPI|nr:Tyrosine-protein kinase RYK [Stylophora pistillata]
MTVPSRVDCLRFIWYSTRSPSNAVGYDYVLKLSSLTPDILIKPTVNIKKAGVIPETKKDLHTSARRKPTVVQVPNDHTEANPPVSPLDKTTVFYIAVGVACSIILIIALAVAAIHVHSMPRPDKDGDTDIPGRQESVSKTPLIAAAGKPKQETSSPAINGNQGPQNVPIPAVSNTNQIPVLTANNVTASVPLVTNLIPNGGVHVPHIRPRLPGGFPVRDSTISITPSDGNYGGGGLQSTQKGKYGNRDMKAELKDLEVDMDRITLGDLLEEGTFARIYNGVLTGPREAQQQSVLVKTVSGMASEDQVNLLLIESSMLKDLTHKNLLPVMAVCLEDERQPLIMFPFMNRGNLKMFIKKSRSPEGGSKSLTTADLVHVGIQIAKGLQYLARRRITHKDVAARNCVIDDDLNVKVTDCALSRDLFPQDYCCLGDNENRPVKWMAVESLEKGRFTVASDVPKKETCLFSLPLLLSISPRPFKVGVWCPSVGIDDSGTAALREYRRFRNAQLPQTRTQNFAADELPG